MPVYACVGLHGAAHECHVVIRRWRDDAVAKWHTLNEWAQGWKDANPGLRDDEEHPLIWFDRACLDQQNIDASLAGLPVYLSGCKLLLVLPGETYTSRLWCVMEVFTWLSLGRDHDMTVMPIMPPITKTITSLADAGAQLDSDVSVSEASTASQSRWMRASHTVLAQREMLRLVREAILTFRAQRAQCFKPEDRDRLLGIVESSFGTFHEFNSRVRTALLNCSMLGVDIPEPVRKQQPKRRSFTPLTLHDVSNAVVKDMRSRAYEEESEQV